VQRICGVCTGVHALASVRAVENALKIQIPENANTIRNIMHLTLYSQDHRCTSITCTPSTGWTW
jgi:hydrogenase large subunit